ncbi:hypothetical protein S40293_05693 [Stachybotrys chartarum IBT 40293]|nr:hypothetical protein S40293_05693 [Stachybotrys chartarum IBT 40293]
MAEDNAVSKKTSNVDLALYECAIGYALFTVKRQSGGISLGLKEVASINDDLAKFGKMVELKSFVPFRNTGEALANVNDISEGIVPEYLKSFLDLNLPKTSGKKSKVVLGVAEAKLAGSLRALYPGFDYETSDTNHVVCDLLRGIRQFHDKFIPGVKADEIEKAGLALGHAYSRARVKFDPAQEDRKISIGLASLETQDKQLNANYMHLINWFSHEFPELAKICSKNEEYPKLMLLIGHKASLTEENKEALMTIFDNDEDKADAVIDAAKVSMGMDLRDEDIEIIGGLANKCIANQNARNSYAAYLEKAMRTVAPNLHALLGTIVGARLIAQSGSLVKLAKEPASTIQILGAEKALFRALKTKSNTPKYGLLYHSSFVQRAKTKDKGRISRYVANKCAIAARIDCFSEKPTAKYGEAFRQQVEDRLEFYNSGKKPAKNQDVMDEVAAFLGGDDLDEDAEDDDAEDIAMADAPAEPVEEKKSKKDKKEKKEKKDKKEKRKRDSDVAMLDSPAVNGDSKKSKKKSKSKATDPELAVPIPGDENTNPRKHSKHDHATSPSCKEFPDRRICKKKNKRG